jgi:hypothetical protein
MYKKQISNTNMKKEICSLYCKNGMLSFADVENKVPFEIDRHTTLSAISDGGNEYFMFSTKLSLLYYYYTCSQVVTGKPIRPFILF